MSLSCRGVLLTVDAVLLLLVGVFDDDCFDADGTGNSDEDWIKLVYMRLFSVPQ